MKEKEMDIKVTFDITPALADLAGRLCDALKSNAARIPAHCIPAPAPSEPLKWDTTEKAENPPAERPAPTDVPEPAPAPENAPDAKTDVTAPAIEEPPVEPVKKRSHHKKADASKTEPAPEPVEAPAEPEPPAEPESVEVPKDDPAPAAEAEPEPAPKPADAPAMTLDEIRAVCVQAAKAGKTNVVTGYLNAHGAASLSKLDPALYTKLADIVKAAL